MGNWFDFVNTIELLKSGPKMKNVCLNENWKLRFVGNLLTQCGEKYFGWFRRIVCKMSSSG